MKIRFVTNLDKYKEGFFPSNITFVPRKGEMVSVKRQYREYFIVQKLPSELEVVKITYHENMVVCELWYNQLDKKIAEMAGAKILG